MLLKSKIFIAATACLMIACSKTDMQADAVVSNQQSVQTNLVSGSETPDYKLICERLAILAPEGRKATVSENCIAEYKQMLPSCQNAAAVNNCYANMKDWSERLACLDSCVRK